MTPMKRVLLTGSTGFVGRSLHMALTSLYSVVATSRSPQTLFDGSSSVDVGELSAKNQWASVLQSVDCIVHVAGRAHKLNDSVGDPLSVFRKVNVEGTLNLARQASEAGIKRFVFISSVGVHGLQTLGKPLDEFSLLIPHIDYAISKMEAERGLQDISKASGMESVIIRPPLVYAGHAPGNFQLLLRLVASGLPLPFGRIKNERSMIALENLIDLISLCIDHPAAANQTFLVSDGIDLSTPEIIRYLAEGMGRNARLFPAPDLLMRGGAALLGKETAYSQLCGSLTIDSAKARRLLAWVPPAVPADALLKAGQDYISMQFR